MAVESLFSFSLWKIQSLRLKYRFKAQVGLPAFVTAARLICEDLRFDKLFFKYIQNK